MPHSLLHRSLRPWVIAVSLIVVLSGGSARAEGSSPEEEPFRVTKLEGEELSRLVNSLDGKSFDDFRSFLQEITPALASPEDSRLALKYITGLKLGSQPVSLYRLLGVQTRIRYRDQMISLLAELVAIPTFKKPDVPQHHNPEILRLGERIEREAKAYGLEYRNIDNRVFEVSLPGSTPEYLGIYTHGDVVPANPDEWVLEDGTRLDPFKLTRIGDLLYGRGTEDDKCSIVAALIAMRAIKESALPLRRGIRLIVETTEETSGEGFEYYKERNPIPPYNLVLDSGYPLVTAEKGFGSVFASFPVKEARGAGVEVIEVNGAQAINQIPATAAVFLRAPDLHALKTKVDQAAAEFVKANGGDFEIKTQVVENTLDVRVLGRSAHSASPESGLNPVPRALAFVHALKPKLPLRENHYTDAARYAVENFGLEHFGKTLGVAYADDFMGPLTMSLTLIDLKDGKLRVGVNLRNPRGKEANTLKKEIEDKLTAYRTLSKLTFEHSIEVDPHMLRDAKGAWLQTLLKTFAAVTGKEAKPLSASGTTTAKQLPNGVNFGPAHPGEKYMGHNANEFKKVGNFLFDAQMFTEAFLRLGNLEKME